MPVYTPPVAGTVFNVKDFGAAGDSGTNDATAIQAAVSAAHAAGGGTVYFPKGVYVVSTANFNLANSTNGVKLVGQAGFLPGSTPAAVIRSTYTPGTNFNTIFSATGAVGLEIRNLQFEVPFATPIYYTLNLTSSTDVTLDHVSLENTSGTQRAYGVMLTNTVRVAFEHCYFYNFVRGIDTSTGTKQQFTIRDSYFSSCATAVLFGSQATGFTIQGNTFATCATAAIDFGSVAHTNGFVSGSFFTGVTTRYKNYNGGVAFIEAGAYGPAQVYNVVDYGALGDGTTDDATAINAALAAANNAGGGTVFFPRGTYVMASQLAMGSKTNVRLQGASTSVEQAGTVSGVTIKSTLSGTSVTCFNFSSSRAATVQGIRFQATGMTAQTTTTLADFSSATDLLVTDCTFLNSSASAMFGTVSVVGSARTTFDRCWFSNLYQGLSGSTASYLTVRESTFTGCYYGMNNTPTQLLVQRCQFTTTTAAWFHLLVTSPYARIDTCGFSATSTAPNLVNINAANVTIINNNFQGTGLATTNGLLGISSGSGVRISGNFFNSAAGGVAIDIAGGSLTGEVAHNTFHANVTTRYAFGASVNYGGLVISDNLYSPAGATHPAVATDAARWYSVVEGVCNQSVTGSAGATWAVPYLPTRPVTLSKIAVKVTLGNTMSLRAGIYADTGTGLPGALIVDCGLVSASSTGIVTWATNLPVVLGPRLHWVVLTPQSVTANASLECTTGRSRHVGDTAVNPSGVDGYAAYVTAAGQHTAAYPATFGAISTLHYAPAMYVQLK